PVKAREAKERRPAFSVEALDLFRELEGTPPRQRDSDESLAKSKRLASLLGLSTEWWGGQHVEHSDTLQPPEWLPAHNYWTTVQQMRRALLEAGAVRQ